ncbi:hypothetical protein Tco_0659241 [Tanacetum coccineum]
MLSKGIHEQTNHEKLKPIINISADDQIDSNIIFDDPYVENYGGIYGHDSNAHDQSFGIESMIYNVQKEVENQERINTKLKKQKALLQKELETCKERVKTLEKKPIQFLNYNEAYEYLEHEIGVENDTIERLLKEKDKIQGKSIQTILMLGKKPNKVYDYFLKAGLGHQNPEHLKNAIAAQPKMYDGKRLQSTKLINDSPISEDAKESRLKMKDKMIQLDYEKLNALYDTFVPQQEISIEQTYFSTPSTSNKIEMLMLEKEKISNDSKDIQATMEQRIKILENDFDRAEAQYNNIGLKMQHQKEKMTCDYSWKSMMTKLSNENVLLKTKVESVVQEGENIKLESKDF